MPELDLPPWLVFYDVFHEHGPALLVVALCVACYTFSALRNFTRLRRLSLAAAWVTLSGVFLVALCEIGNRIIQGATLNPPIVLASIALVIFMLGVVVVQLKKGRA